VPDVGKLRNDNGFTLVEMMVALALLSVVFTAVNSFFLSSVTAWHRSQDKAEVEENLRIGMNRLSRELRQAESIVSYDNTSQPRGRLTFQAERNNALKTISYYCSSSGDPEAAYQLIRAVSGEGNNPVARYVTGISVSPANCGAQTKLLTVTLEGEKGKSGVVRVSTTIMLRGAN